MTTYTNFKYDLPTLKVYPFIPSHRRYCSLPHIFSKDNLNIQEFDLFFQEIFHPYISIRKSIMVVDQVLRDSISFLNLRFIYYTILFFMIIFQEIMSKPSQYLDFQIQIYLFFFPEHCTHPLHLQEQAFQFFRFFILHQCYLFLILLK